MEKDILQQLYPLIFESISDGVFTVDSQGRITSFNRAAEEITEFTRREAVGEYCFNIFRANICEKYCALKQTIHDEQPVRNLPITILTKTGKIKSLSISTAVLKDESDNTIGGVETFRDISNVVNLRHEIKKSYCFEDMISKNHKMQQIFEILPDIAESDSTVLISGPSGSGKEILARAIHNLSHRRDGPFIAVNCGALPESLLESEFFGYRKGAFTGATDDRKGRFVLANRGTLFLDEIAELPLVLQVKLLRVLQDKLVEPLGAGRPVQVDVRIIAATNRDINDMVSNGTFREDLFYRLNVIRISLPPLKERREDIPLLIELFIEKFNAIKGKQIKGISNDALRLLFNHSFPGNIRELENIVEYAFVVCKGGIIQTTHLPPELLEAAGKGFIRPVKNEERTLAEWERIIIRNTLERYGGQKIKASRALGIDPSTLWRKMKRYSIDGKERETD